MGQNVLFWWGSCKRPDLQTAYRYMAESFRVDCNIRGRYICAITRADIMRVSHSGRPKLNILEILKHLGVASEPCRHATSRTMYLIFLMRALPALTYRACNDEGMNLHSLATVLCQIWWEFRWNLVIYRSKCPILMRVHQTGRSPNGL